MQTPAGAIKAKQTLVNKYGQDYWKNLGKLGGQNGRGHAFAHGKVDPSIVGKKGGTISRRGKSEK